MTDEELEELMREDRRSMNVIVWAAIMLAVALASVACVLIWFVPMVW